MSMYRMMFVFSVGTFIVLVVFNMCSFPITKLHDTPGESADPQYHCEQSPNCSVRLQNFKLSKRLPWCTWTTFKDYLVQKSAFYGEGVWSNLSNTSNSDLIFYPKHCRLPNRLKTLDDIKHCFARKKINYILFTGDSTFRLFALNLISWIQSICGNGFQVQELPPESDLKRYFELKNVAYNKIQSAGCLFGETYCLSRYFQCSFNNISWTLKVEFIPIWSILDGSLRILYGHHGDFTARTLSAESKLEYLLKYYLPEKGFPDMWVYGPSIHHEAWKHSLDAFRADLQYVLQMFEKFLPHKTQLIFQATTRECPAKRPKQIDQAMITFWNSTRNQRIHQMNHVLAKTLTPHMEHHDNYKAFLDGMRLSCPLECDMHDNGAHMLDIWYQKLASYFMELACFN